MVLLERSAARGGAIDTWTGTVTARLSPSIPVASNLGGSIKSETPTGGEATDTARLTINCLGDPDAAGGTVACTVQGSADNVNWQTIATIAQTDFAAVAVGVATTQTASKTFSPFPFNRISTTTVGQTTQVYTAYFQF
jgi:hypothetical protein